MEILRVSPYSYTASVDVTDASTEYEYTLKDMADNSVTTGTVTSDLTSQVTVSIPSKYDNQYLLEVDGEETLIEVVRPYVNANDMAETASEIAEYKKNEELARAIIDSVISQGFYYRKRVIETTGNGSDYVPLWLNVKKLLKVYENNVLVYDAEDPDSYDRSFQITKDKTAITQATSDLVNRSESAPLVLPAAGSDWLDMKYTFRGFPKTFDYQFVVEEGYRNVPSDIVRATEMLVDDISCGRLDYFKQYVTDYNTDQFKIKFDTRSFEGTGNILVDKILSKYAKNIRTLGVL